MARKRQIALVLLVSLVFMTTGACSSSQEAREHDPNRDLPSMAAPSGGCERLNDLLEESFGTSEPGKNFLKAIAVEDDGTDLAFSEQRSADVEVAWMEFLQFITQESQQERWEEAAGSDQRARDALNALSTYVDSAVKLTDGTITQFENPDEVEFALKEGRQPEENPVFVELSEQMMNSHFVLSECMPSWPVTF